ncbi:hypothetical protein [Modestobacter sp. SSW1-42]|uniref:hypothetical protein n=1 Tax=Modestobacter sp. SSW1-42 TaxID=596372 RepID=UPI003985F873
MSRAAPWLVPALGAGLCAAGVAVFWRTNVSSAAADAGWFAYAPLGQELPPLDPAYESELALAFDDAPWSLLWTPGHLVGVALAVLGSLVLGGWAGRSLGRRPGARRVLPALGVLAGLLVVAGTVLVVTRAPVPVVTYGGSYEPLACADLLGCGTGLRPVQLGAAQLAGLGTAVLGAVLAAAAGAAAVTGAGPDVPGPRRAAARGAVVAGALLAVGGVALAWSATAAVPELVFLSPEQYDQLVDAAWLAGVGRVLLAVGALLAAAAVPQLLRADRSGRASRVAGAALGAAVGLTVLGGALLWSAHTSQQAVEVAAHSRLAGPGLWAGLVVVLVGGALLGAGVRQVTGERPPR